MRRSPRPALALALLLAAGTGCNTWYNDVPSPDNLLAQVPWFDHMISSQAVFPYSRLGVPRNTPPGTVPVTVMATVSDEDTTPSDARNVILNVPTCVASGVKLKTPV